ncbi:MAG: SPFH domain-containing protein, partial [Anaerolineales bacterium]
MKRKPIVAITLLLIIAFTVVPAAAQEGGFTDSFDDPQLPEWEHSPEAVVAEGALQIGPGNFAARGGGWQDFELSFKLKFSGPGESHINYRASDSGSYLLILLEDAVVLLKNQGEGQESELAVSPGWQPSQNAWMEFKITLQGGQHSISIDGSEIISASDSEPLAQGGVVFASHGERTTTIDDVSLQVLVPEAGGEPQPGAAVEPVAVESVPTALPTQAPNALQSILDQQTDPWGIKIAAVEVKHVDLPPEMQRAMAKQAEAEREKRAKIIHAHGEQQAAENLALAARKLSKEPSSLQLRYLQTLTEIAAER